MIKRPLNPRFTAAVLAGQKFTKTLMRFRLLKPLTP